MTRRAQVLANTGYRRLLAGQIISNLGDVVAYMGLSFLILYRLGGTAVDIGKLTIAATVPTLVLGPVAGTLVDRWSRRWVMVFSDAGRGVIYLLMPLAPSLNWIYAGVFLSNVLSRFFYPAKSAMVPNIVGKEQIVAATGLTQAAAGMTAVLGPGIGAAVAAFLGPSTTLVLNGVSFLLSGVFIMGIRGNEKERSSEPDSLAAPRDWKGKVRDVLSELASGFRYILDERVIRFYAGVFAGFGLLVGGLNVIVIPFLKDVMGFGIPLVGLTQSAQAVGGLLGAVLITLRPVRRPRRTILGALVTFGTLIVLVMGVNRYLWAVFPAAALIGAAVASVQVLLNAELMRLVPDRLRGRVFGSFSSLTDGLGLASMGIIPLLAVRFGIAEVGMATGGLLALLGLSAAFWAKGAEEPGQGVEGVSKVGRTLVARGAGFEPSTCPVEGEA